jgi:hypothetical protein
VDDVRIREEPALRYASMERQLRADAIDAFVRRAIEDLRREHRASGKPFTMYHGCSKDDEQIVQVCVPTDDGAHELPAQPLAFTVVRGPECAYPEILKAYDAVVAFAENAGRALGGAPRETYLTDPGEDDPQMEIAFPLLT